MIETTSTYYQVGKAPWLAGGGATNVVATLSECHKSCLGIDECKYGTYLSSGRSKGQCWLSQYTHKSRSIKCGAGASCSAFTKLSSSNFGAVPTPAPVVSSQVSAAEIKSAQYKSKLPFSPTLGFVITSVVKFALVIPKIANEPLLGSNGPLIGLRKIRRATAAALSVDSDVLALTFFSVKEAPDDTGFQRRLATTPADSVTVMVEVAVRTAIEKQHIEQSIYGKDFSRALQVFLNSEGIQGSVLVHPLFPKLSSLSGRVSKTASAAKNPLFWGVILICIAVLSAQFAKSLSCSRQVPMETEMRLPQGLNFHHDASW